MLKIQPGLGLKTSLLLSQNCRTLAPEDPSKEGHRHPAEVEPGPFPSAGHLCKVHIPREVSDFSSERSPNQITPLGGSAEQLPLRHTDAPSLALFWLCPPTPHWFLQNLRSKWEKKCARKSMKENNDEWHPKKDLWPVMIGLLDGKLGPLQPQPSDRLEVSSSSKHQDTASKPPNVPSWWVPGNHAPPHTAQHDQHGSHSANRNTAL